MKKIILFDAGQFFRKNIMAVFFVVMIIVFTCLRSSYFSLDNFKTILIQASMLGIISCGMTIVMMTGGADLSVGAVAGLSAISGLWFVVNSGLPLFWGIILGLAAGAIIGAINGFCVARLGVAPFVATLGTMFLAQGLQYMISGGGLSISFGFPSAYLFMGSGSLGPVPMPVVIFLAVAAALIFLTEFSPPGRYLRASGLNQFTAELSGVRVRFYTFLSYVIGGILAGVLGLVLGAFQSYISPAHGDSFLMDSLIVALLGKSLLNGRVSIYGTIFGAFFFRAFETGLSMVGIPVTVLNVSKGLLLVGILLINLINQNKRGKGLWKRAA